jgi:hypothetical protein
MGGHNPAEWVDSLQRNEWSLWSGIRSQTSPVSVTIRFYNETGVLVNTVTDSVAAKSSPYYAWNTYTSSPFGTVTVEASGRISVTESIAGEIEGKLGIFKGINE